MKHYPGMSNYPGLTFKAQLSSILCAAWKVHGEEKTTVIKAWDYSRWNKNINDDYTVVSEIVKVMSTADAIVTHNGKRFDWKFLQTRLLLHGLPPLPSIPHIDTCTLAKSNIFMFNNRLGNLGQAFVKDDKIDNGGWDLWTRIQFERKPKDLKLMADYCKQDVDLLDKLFKVLRPFAKNIPNHNLFLPGQTKVCASCGSTRLIKWGYRYTKTNAFPRLRCKDCGSTNATDASGKNPRSV